MIEMAGPNPVGNPQVLLAGGSYHDGRSYNGQYIVTSYRQLIMRDILGQKDVQLFTYPNNGKSTNGSTQVCNASISPDSSFGGRCLFEDFGASTGSTLVGSSYGVHQYLFVAEFSGIVDAWYKCPDGESAWDFPKWSNTGQFAIACGVNGADAPHAVYLVDLQKKTTLKILEGVEFADPYLWVNPLMVLPIDAFALDSLGQYNAPSTSYTQPFYATRMLAFWKNCKKMKVVFTGSSHTAFGVDPQSFSMPGVYNMSIPGGDFPIESAMITNYLVNQCDSLRLVGMDLIPGLMQYPNILFVAQWDSGIVSSMGFNYDKSHNYWEKGLPSNYLSLMNQVAFPQLPDFDTLGVYRHDCQGWGGTTPDYNSSSLNWTTDDSVYKTNMILIKNCAKQLAQRGIHFLIYLTPESPFYGNFNTYDAAGPNIQTAGMIISELIALQDSVPGFFHFYDANKFGNHDFTDADAYDAAHLCTIGAQKFSVRLDSLVKVLLGS